MGARRGRGLGIFGVGGYGVWGITGDVLGGVDVSGDEVVRGIEVSGGTRNT